MSPSFALGNFVLVRFTVDRGHKLQFCLSFVWRTTTIYSNLVFDFKPLQSKFAERIHFTRLTKYKDILGGTCVSQQILDLSNRFESIFEVAERITDISGENGVLFLCV